MKINECPKFSNCNAPLCPLDSSIYERAYVRGESICFYMLEFQKTKSYERFKMKHIEVLYEAISNVVIIELHGYSYILNRLEDASKTSSRMSNKIIRHS